jgi:hypothetical protein
VIGLLLLGIGVVCGAVIGGIAMVYYLGRGMWR